MGLLLLTQTLLNCIFTGLLTKSFWFSYILFLIFIGGILILFIYMSSLASNEQIKFSPWFFIKWNTILFRRIFLIIILDKFYFISFFINNESMFFFNSHNLLEENYLMLSKIYDMPNNLIIILLINYLLLTLITVVKITHSFRGPLRPKQYY